MRTNNTCKAQLLNNIIILIGIYDYYILNALTYYHRLYDYLHIVCGIIMLYVMCIVLLYTYNVYLNEIFIKI